MARVRQTFTNRLPQPLVIWIEMNCWCFVIQPEERLTVEFDAEGYSGDWEPLPVDLLFDGVGEDRLPMLIFWNQGRSDPSFFINDEAVVTYGDLTEFGEERYVKSR